LANFAKKDCFEHQKIVKHTAPADDQLETAVSS